MFYVSYPKFERRKLSRKVFLLYFIQTLNFNLNQQQQKLNTDTEKTKNQSMYTVKIRYTVIAYEEATIIAYKYGDI